MQAHFYTIRPLADPRWDAFTGTHPRASAFHSRAWLTALRRTYGYEPEALTTSQPHAALRDALVFCEVDSWLSGRRLVSLPFSDHCEPLIDPNADVGGLFSSLETQVVQRSLAYCELRPVHTLPAKTTRGCSTSSYVLHQLDLAPAVEVLFQNCHRDSIQRKIRRAGRERLLYDEGRSETLLDHFYDLLIETRRRHYMLPQPKAWFRNLAESFKEALKIRVAYVNRRAVAAILTLRFQRTLVYKYGCSDSEYNRLGGVQFLLWRCIQEAKQDGLETLDLGRSDIDQPGLIRFKDRWGAHRLPLHYLRLCNRSCCSGERGRFGSDLGRSMRKAVVPRCPKRLLGLVGAMLYRHAG
jgi:CelD/BcsL family acetyltransferase involved in cellulose biosynthesis